MSAKFHQVSVVADDAKAAEVQSGKRQPPDHRLFVTEAEMEALRMEAGELGKSVEAFLVDVVRVEISKLARSGGAT